MTKHEIPEAFVDWTQNMLTDRNLTISLSKATIGGRPTRDCPQGEVLTPLLWCLVVDEFLTKLKEAGFLVFGYADDVAVVVRSNFLNPQRTHGQNFENYTRLVHCCGFDGQSVQDHGMIFTRKYKPEPIEPLKLWGKEITYANSVKYLGATLDAKLSWKLHLKEKKKKFYKNMRICRRARAKRGA